MSQPPRLDSSIGSGRPGSVKRLVTRACDACRKKKIRCEPSSSDICAQCIKSMIPCHFTPISVSVSKRRMTRDRRVEELEKRLASMEGQLRPLKGHHLQGPTTTESAKSVPFSEVPNMTTPSQQMLIESPRLDSFQYAQSTASENPVFQVLPSREKASYLVKTYFQGVNTVVPIFDQDTFMAQFDSAYGLDCRDSDPGWWAALNVVLALAYQYWDMPDPDPEEDLEAWGYFQNALAAVNQLMATRYTLASVQALLGMAMILTAMPHQNPSTLLTSSAIKIAHNLGLHRQDQDPTLSAVESAERMRVFWVAYSLDKDISLQTRQPPTQGDEDMDVEPPTEHGYGPVRPGGIHHSLFYFRTRLAIIQGQIYRRLLSVKAGKQSPSERAMAAAEVETTLQTWRRSVPIDLFNDPSGAELSGTSWGTSNNPVYLQLLYFKTLAVIYESVPTLPWYPEIKSSQVRVHIMSAPVTYPVEARSAMHLLNVTPRRKFACIWTSLHIFVTAATTLLVHTISNPSNSLVQGDLKLLEPFLNLLGFFARSSVNEKVGEMYQSSMNLFEQARIAIGHSDSDSKVHPPMGAGEPGGKESVEDFLERIEQIISGDGTGDNLISQSAWQ